MTTRTITLATLALAAFAVHAQEAAPAAEAAPVADIQLGVDSGSVLVSSGGEFIQAAPGQILAPGHRVLVSEGAAATLTYANGCQKALASAGVYIVNDDCDLASTTPGSSNAGVIAGVPGGVALIAAAPGGGGGSARGQPTPPPPPPPRSQ